MLPLVVQLHVFTGQFPWQPEQARSTISDRSAFHCSKRWWRSQPIAKTI